VDWIGIITFVLAQVFFGARMTGRIMAMNGGVEVGCCTMEFRRSRNNPQYSKTVKPPNSTNFSKESLINIRKVMTCLDTNRLD
jgi:anaerobic C4-dicarboxylate transporter